MILKDFSRSHTRAFNVAGRIQSEQSGYPHIINSFLNMEPLIVYLKNLV
jgi:hypothetical protein